PHCMAQGEDLEVAGRAAPAAEQGEVEEQADGGIQERWQHRQPPGRIVPTLADLLISGPRNKCTRQSCPRPRGPGPGPGSTSRWCESTPGPPSVRPPGRVDAAEACGFPSGESLPSYPGVHGTEASALGEQGQHVPGSKKCERAPFTTFLQY